MILRLLWSLTQAKFCAQVFMRRPTTKSRPRHRDTGGRGPGTSCARRFALLCLLLAGRPLRPHLAAVGTRSGGLCSGTQARARSGPGAAGRKPANLRLMVLGQGPSRAEPSRAGAQLRQRWRNGLSTCRGRAGSVSGFGLRQSGWHHQQPFVMLNLSGFILHPAPNDISYIS